MFANCELLETIDVSNFNTESVNYLTYMFLNCSKVKKLDLSYFQFEDPVEMAEMLAGTTSLNELTLGKGYRFVDSANLPAIPVEDGNTGYWQKRWFWNGYEPCWGIRANFRRIDDELYRSDGRYVCLAERAKL